ncbi:MAG: CHASE3 domain-containing protein [Vampirovibrionales bacterium]|nr:CHASE3 domain-containing protein [Vampirovibrionales bacterium]
MFKVLHAVRKEVLAMFIGSFILLLLMQAVSFWSMGKADSAREQQGHSNRISDSLANLLSDVKDVETGVRGFVLTNDRAYLAPYYSSMPTIDKHLKNLAGLIHEPGSKKNLQNIEALVKKRVGISKNIVQIQMHEGGDKAIQAVKESRGKAIMDELRQKTLAMIRHEAFLTKQAEELAQSASKFTRILYNGAFVLILLMQGVAFYTILQEVMQRREAEEKVKLLNRNLENHIIELAKEISDRTSAERKVNLLNQELNDQVQLLNETNHTLNTVNHELESFAYSVSHDLRAPLRGIDGFSLALLEDYGDKVDEVGKSYLERVRYESQRMGMLIDGILSLSRLTRGEIHKSEVNLSELSQKIVKTLEKETPERQIKVTIENDLMAQADPRLIEPALENLLSNAWKFTSKKPEAEIEFGHLEQEGKTVYFIKDNGAGFDMAHVNKLFGPFQRLHGMAEYPGTGIGLATVQRIITRHGGSIWTEAKVNEGATFFFTLA